MVTQLPLVTAASRSQATRHSRTQLLRCKMSLEITEELNISDIKFIRTRHEGKYSSIFKVEWRGQACALKVVSNYR